MAFGLMVLGLVLGYLRHLRSLRSTLVERILDRVEGEVVDARLMSDTVRGRHDGRAFRMRLGTKAKYTLFARSLNRGWRFLYPLEIEIELPCAPAIELRVRRVYPVPRYDRDEDPHDPQGFMRRHVVAGVDDFDPLQTAREARVSLSTLLGRCGLDEVSLVEGRLRATGRLRRVGPQELNAILSELEILAREFDRRPAMEIGVAERYVWVGSDDRRARCAYCHDDLGQDDLVSCGRCQTLTHAECYGEHGGCPILGCGGHLAAPIDLGKGDPKGGLDLHSGFGSAPGPGPAPRPHSQAARAHPSGPRAPALPPLAVPPGILGAELEVPPGIHDAPTDIAPLDVPPWLHDAPTDLAPLDAPPDADSDSDSDSDSPLLEPRSGPLEAPAPPSSGPPEQAPPLR